MSKSFNSRLRDALDDTHCGEGRLRTADHYRLKRAMRQANMEGRQFDSAESFALYVASGRGFR